MTQENSHFIINIKVLLLKFLLLISVSAEIPQAQRNEDTNGNLILTIFELING